MAPPDKTNIEKASRQNDNLQGFMELTVLTTFKSLSRYNMSTEYRMKKVCIQSLLSNNIADDGLSLGRPMSPLIFSQLLVVR